MTLRPVISRRECANPACDVWFDHPHNGPQPARFCSVGCHKPGKPKIKPKATSGFAVEPAQRAAVLAQFCLACGRSPVDPAHLIPRSLLPDDGDVLSVVPLCRWHHRLYDTGELDLLPHLEAEGWRSHLGHAVGRFGLVRTLEVVTGSRWMPVETRAA